MQTFAAIIIGDEILSGKRQDKHLAKVIQILAERGLRLSGCEYVGDDTAQITRTLQRSFASDNIVFSFGGIGATPDDLTRQAAAASLGVPLVRNAESVAEIVAQYGEAAYPKRVLMADLPEGSAIIPNPVNRVPGFYLREHYFLPGFPEMAWPMMEWVLDTHYAALFHQQAEASAQIIVIGAAESDLLDLMNAIVRDFPQVKLFSLPSLKSDGRDKQIELGVKGEAEQVASAMARIRQGVGAIGFMWRE